MRRWKRRPQIRVGAGGLVILAVLWATITLGTSAAGAYIEPAPILHLDTGTITFGPTPINVTSAPKVVNVSNLGNAPLLITDIHFSPTGEGVAGDPRTCPEALDPGDTCQISARYRPGTSEIGIVQATVETNAGTRAITYRGSTIKGSFPIRVTPQRFTFGSVKVGTTAPTRSVVLTNITANPVFVEASLEDAFTAFTITNQCGGESGTVLAAGASCTIDFSFAPTEAVIAGYYGRLFVRGDASRTFELGVSGYGVPTTDSTNPVVLTPSWIDFGDVPLGTTSPPQTLFVTNTLDVDATVTPGSLSLPAPFAIQSTCLDTTVVLHAGETCPIHVTYSPTEIGASREYRSLPIDLVSPQVSGIHELNVRGFGRGNAPLLVPSRDVVNFRPTTTGTISGVQTVTIRNEGNRTSAPITVGDPGSAFDLRATTCTTLTPGATCTASYTFTGSATDTTPLAKSTITAGTHATQVILWGGGPPAAPVAIDDQFAAYGDQAFVADDPATALLATDTGTALRVSGAGTGAHGTVAVEADGTFRYVPSPGFRGTDSFTYTVVDVAGATASATATITVDSPNQAFVEASYADFLGRTPTTGEAEDTIAALDAGPLTRRTVITGFATSSEWIGAIVTDLYQDTLGRAPDPGGLAHWTGQIRTGRRTVAQVAAEFYASGEYYRRAGGTDAAWVGDLYVQFLGRSADPGGLAYWVGQTAAKGRPNVASRFYQSAESRRARVTSLYQDLLGRAPDPSGLTHWTARILTNGDLALAVELASSNEYFARAQRRFPAG